MTTPTAAALANPAFVQAMKEVLDNATFTQYLTLRDWLPKPPKFRQSREVSARRAAKLRKRGEYVHFVRWDHGHCIYSWSGPTPETFTQRLGPWQSPTWQGERTTYRIETRYIVGDAT